MPIYVYQMNDLVDCVRHKPTLPCMTHKCCLFLWFYSLCHANSKLRFFFLLRVWRECNILDLIHYETSLKCYFSQSSSDSEAALLGFTDPPSASAQETSKMPQLCTPCQPWVCLLTSQFVELLSVSKLFQLGKKDFSLGIKTKDIFQKSKFELKPTEHCVCLSQSHSSTLVFTSSL